MPHHKQGEYEHRQRQGEREVKHDFELEGFRTHSIPQLRSRSNRDPNALSRRGKTIGTVISRLKFEPNTREIIRLAVLQSGGFDRHQTQEQEPPFTPTATQREYRETAGRLPTFARSSVLQQVALCRLGYHSLCGPDKSGPAWRGWGEEYYISTLQRESQCTCA
jgi:hypothetical protein